MKPAGLRCYLQNLRVVTSWPGVRFQNASDFAAVFTHGQVTNYDGLPTPEVSILFGEMFVV